MSNLGIHAGPWTVLERISNGDRRPCKTCEHLHEYRVDPDAKTIVSAWPQDRKMHTWAFCEAGCPRHTYEQMSVQEYAEWFLAKASADA